MILLKKLELDNNYEKIDNNEILKIVREIYSNYLYINMNHKYENHRILSSANSLFESL